MRERQFLLKKFNTSLTPLLEKEKKSIFQKLKKYTFNPLLALQKIKCEFIKSNIEIDWEERTKICKTSAVLSKKYNKSEYKRIDSTQKKILYKILKSKIKKNYKILDFGCGAGRFSDFFTKDLKAKYFGVDSSISLLKFKKNKKNQKFMHLTNFSNNQKYAKFFDVVFIFTVLGGIPNKKINAAKEIIYKTIKNNGFLFFVELVRQTTLEGAWRYRTINFYKTLFKKFKIDSNYYFLQDNNEYRIFFGKKI
jgi:2-polyprenyl-3-methyl-5-hydroxy-6-metoxy-1,4-benzoquinol methylase